MLSCELICTLRRNPLYATTSLVEMDGMQLDSSRLTPNARRHPARAPMKWLSAGTASQCQLQRFEAWIILTSIMPIYELTEADVCRARLPDGFVIETG